jgi:DNA-binding CsgD family transcriptional regulator
MQAVIDLETLPSRVVVALQRVVPSESTFWTEVDARTRQAVRLVYPTDVRLRNEDHLVTQFAQQHPVYRHYQRTRDGSAHMLTDFVSLRQWRRGPLYNEMYRRRRIEHQMSVSFSPTPGRTVGAMLNRKRDFSERDRLALDLVRPHLVEIYRRLETTARIRGELAHAHSAIEHVPCGVVVVGRDGRLAFANARARRALATFFAEGAAPSGLLPDPITRWLREHGKGRIDLARPRQALVVTRGHDQLAIRVIEDDGDVLLVMEERSERIDPAPLTVLGLTPRETDVLAWVSCGKTDADIATILGTRPKTIGKHLEHIYRKLGVETRTAAAARALAVAG